MIRDGKKVIVLYLEDWQMRMVKDFLGVECDKWEVPVETEGENVTAMYISRVPCNSEYKRMYLTDWQMKEVRDEAGITCDFIELTKEVIGKYGVITPYGVPPA